MSRSLKFSTLSALFSGSLLLASGFADVYAGEPKDEPANDPANKPTSELTSGLVIPLTPADLELPTFELPDLDEQAWTAESLAGQPYIVNFWATWCGPCVHELPAMNRAAAQLIDEGVGMVAINLGEGSRAVKAFMQQVPIEFPVLLGNSTTFPNWNVKGLPTTYIVSAEGKIIASAVGPREWDNPEFIEYMLSLRAES